MAVFIGATKKSKKSQSLTTTRTKRFASPEQRFLYYDRTYGGGFLDSDMEDKIFEMLDAGESKAMITKYFNRQMKEKMQDFKDIIRNS